MKKLNITKEQYDKSDYFTKKYGSIKFVSESGKKMYKTDKGVVLTLEGKEVKEDIDGDDTPISVDTDKEEGEVTRTELTEMLTSVADELKKACDSQDIPFEEVVGLESDGEKEDDDGESFDESEEEDGEEVIATKEDVAEVLCGVIDAVKDVADKAGVELPEEEEGDDEPTDDDGEFEILDEEEEEDGDGKKCPHCGKKCECGNSRTKMMESIRSRRAIRKVRESLKRKAVRGKMLESARRRAKIRKMLESRKAKMERRAKVLESIKRRARLRKMMESRKVASRKVAPKGFRKIKR